MDKKIIDFIMRFRHFVFILILAITVFFGYGITKMQFYTQFMDLFPYNHEYVKIHKKFMDTFGGANVGTLVLEVKDGDIFNEETLNKLVRIQDEVEKIPGVNPYQIFSIASRRVMNAREIAGGFSMTPVMKYVPKGPVEMADFKSMIFTNPAYGSLVSYDLKALKLTALFVEGRIPYEALFDAFMKIKENENDANHIVYLAGEPILYGWVYHYVPQMIKIFAFSTLVLVVLLVFYMGRQPCWWIPLVSATLSAIWGIGISGYLGYQFDPLIIVVPFLLTARALSHGVQWLNRFTTEFERLGDVKEASHSTGVALFNPAMIGIVTDACGVLIVALIPIPVLQHLAYLGFFWGISVIFTVVLFNPVFVSYLPLKREKLREKTHWEFLTNLMTVLARWSSGRGRWVMVVISIIVLAGGLIGYKYVKIGDANPGSPILWQDSEYNRYVEKINQRFLGIEQMYIQVHSAFGGTLLPDTMRAMDRLQKYLVAKGLIAYGTSSSDFMREINRLLHGNDPKFDIIPNTALEIYQLLAMYQMGAAPEDMDKYMTPSMQDANVRLFMQDHKGDTLRNIIDAVKEWIADPDNTVMAPDPADPKTQIQIVEFIPAGGLGGILAAANEMIDTADDWLIVGILGFTFLCCAVIYRSITAGLIFIISLILANFTAFAYMAWKGIGMNINTLPVVALGVGLGVDYGLYIVSRIKELVVSGATWEAGIVGGVSSTGRAVFYQATMMSASVFFWWFSPLRFQAEMGFLLAILMMVNMIVGVMLLPALIQIIKPKFISRGRQEEVVPETS